MPPLADRKLVFILGQHRSGTTILYNALAASGPFLYPGPFHITHFDAFRTDRNFDRLAALSALSERFAREGIGSRFVDDIPAGPLTPEEYGFALPHGRLRADTVDRFRLFCTFFGEDGPADRLLLLKNPRDLANIAFIQRTFPTARFIFMHRCPGPVIASRIKELRDLFQRYSAYQAVIEPGYATMPAPMRRAIGLAVRFEVPLTMFFVAEFVRNADRLLRAERTLDRSRFRSIRYEDLCRDPRRVLSDLLRFLDLDARGGDAGARLISDRRSGPGLNRVLASAWAERRLRTYVQAYSYPGIWPD